MLFASSFEDSPAALYDLLRFGFLHAFVIVGVLVFGLHTCLLPYVLFFSFAPPPFFLSGGLVLTPLALSYFSFPVLSLPFFFPFRSFFPFLVVLFFAVLRRHCNRNAVAECEALSPTLPNNQSLPFVVLFSRFFHSLPFLFLSFCVFACLGLCCLLGLLISLVRCCRS